MSKTTTLTLPKMVRVLRPPYQQASTTLRSSPSTLYEAPRSASEVGHPPPSTGGRAIIFCPNRLYPFETHGHYWRGQYHFGNTPFINWLPDPLRDRLAPHVSAYTKAGLVGLFEGLPVRVVHHSAIYPGYDNIVYRRPAIGKWLRHGTYALEQNAAALVWLVAFVGS